MRRILLTSYCGLSAIAAVGRRACLAAVLATSLSASSSTSLSAQTFTDVTTMPSAISGEDSGLIAGGLVSGQIVGQPNDQRATSNSRKVPAKLASTPYMNGYDEGFNVAAPMGNACVTPGCDVSMYFNYEAVWLRREGDDNFTLSRLNQMDPFDFELGRFGGRITVGQLFDCHNGVEAVYTGPFEWQRTSNVVGAGNLDSLLSPSGGYTAATIDTFNSADQHVQTYEAKLNNYEINRTWWTWDVVQTLVGIRFVNYEEDYAFSTARVGFGNGLLLNSVNNRAVGAQFGGMLIQPIGLRANYGFRGKLGVMANFDSSNTYLSNANTVVLNSADDSVDLAGVLDMGLFMNYQVVPSVRLTGGCEFLYLPGFATVPAQLPGQINPGSGTAIQNDGDPFFIGASTGVQVLF